MAEVDVSIGGRRYRLHCADGDEARIHDLAGRLDRHAAALQKGGFSFEGVPDARRLLMSAILAVEELTETEARLAELETRLRGAEAAAAAAAEAHAGALRAAQEAQGEALETARREAAEEAAKAAARRTVEKVEARIAQAEARAQEAERRLRETEALLAVAKDEAAGAVGVETRLESATVACLTTAAERLEALAERLEDGAA